ncbi:MAG: hypothetical protein ACLFUR_06665, partial [Candidatus Hadarchaeia archaeon]
RKMTKLEIESGRYREVCGEIDDKIWLILSNAITGRDKNIVSLCSELFEDLQEMRELHNWKKEVEEKDG